MGRAGTVGKEAEVPTPGLNAELTVKFFKVS